MAACAWTWPRGASWHLLPVEAPLPSYSSPYIHMEGQILPTSLEGNKVLHRLGAYIALAICSCHLSYKMWSRGCGYTFTQQLQGHSPYSADELALSTSFSLVGRKCRGARAKIWCLEGGRMGSDTQKRRNCYQWKVDCPGTAHIDSMYS